MYRQKLIALGLLAALAAPVAAEVTTSSVPAVVEQLKQVYGVVQPNQNIGLPELVALQRRHWPQAWVSGTFYDWRTTSIYRRAAGLHLGYDIALPAGTPVAAGWGGRVTSVANWSGPEYGVTVTSPDGTSVTYGHLDPTVAVGTPINVGDTVGLVVRDHVDVKMQDGTGRYVPFGEGQSDGVPSWAPAGRESILVSWLVAKNSVEMVEQDIWQHQSLIARNKLESEQLKRKIPSLQEALKLMTDYEQRGLVSRRKVEETHQELADAKERMRLLKKADPSELKRLQQQKSAAASRLKALEGLARREGYSWKDVDAFVNRWVAKDSSLKTAVEKYKKENGQTRQDRLAALESDVSQGKARLKTLEDLYQMGGLSRQDLQAARENQLLLEKELEAQRKSPTP